MKKEIKLEDVFNDEKRENIKKFIHEVKAIPKEEILANRSNAYEFIDFDKQERSYSEEEVIQLLIKFNQEIQEVEDVREWFEQFKNK